MADETFYKRHNRKSIFHIGVIFMAVVMEGDKVAIIFVNSRRGNNRTPQIVPHVFYGGFGVTSLQPEYDSIGREQTKTATELAYAKVIGYNKKNLERELQNESRQQNRQQSRTKRREKEI